VLEKDTETTPQEPGDGRKPRGNAPGGPQAPLCGGQAHAVGALVGRAAVGCAKLKRNKNISGKNNFLKQILMGIKILTTVHQRPAHVLGARRIVEKNTDSVFELVQKNH